MRVYAPPTSLESRVYLLTRLGIGQYAPYIARQSAILKAFLRDENLRLPPNINYSQIIGLSSEERALLNTTQPESVGQARRIEGMTPNGCIRLLEYVTKRKRIAAATEGVPREDLARGVVSKQYSVLF